MLFRTPCWMPLVLLLLVGCRGASIGNGSAQSAAGGVDLGKRRSQVVHAAGVDPRTTRSGPRVLAVVAHPDDEILFTGVFFEVARSLHGTCDLFTITNGEGGFKYSTLAEHVYHCALTLESVGRARLPEIRWQELLQSAQILHLHEVTSLGECDHRYTQDVTEVYGESAKVWDLARIRRELDAKLARGYDIVLTMAPTPTTHGHHQASALLAVEAVLRLPPAQRPTVLCAQTAEEDDPVQAPALVEGYPFAALRTDHGPLIFDRRRPFGHRDQLHYGVLVDMAIGAHLSQGSMQLLHGKGAREEYYLYSINDEARAQQAAEWFHRLAEAEFATVEYGSSAGTNATPTGERR